MEVIVEPTTASPPEPLAGEDHLLSRWLVVVPLQIGRCGIPSRLNIWEEDQGLYK